MQLFDFKHSVWVAALLVTSIGHADLIYKDAAGKELYKGPAPNQNPAVSCGDDETKAKALKFSVTDAAGNVFEMYCENKSYFQGYVTRVDAPIADIVGRCIYAGGLNVWNFEVDGKNRLKQIEWLNIDPKNAKGLSRGDIYKGVANNDGKPTDEWYPKALKFIQDNMLGSNDSIKQFTYASGPSPTAPLTLADLTDEIYSLGSLLASFSFTPDEAALAFAPNGGSPYPLLVTDSTMGSPGIPAQNSVKTDEPPGWALILSSGCLVLWAKRLARRKCCR